MARKQKPEDSVAPESDSRVRREFANARPELENLPLDQRKAIEAVLGYSLEDYAKHPSEEI